MADYLDVLFWCAVVIAIIFMWYRRQNRSNPDTPSEREDIYRLAAELDAFYRNTAHPNDLLEHPSFQKGLAILSNVRYDLTQYVQGDNQILSCIALETLSRQEPEGLSQYILSVLNVLASWPRWFALGALGRCVPEKDSLLGPLILQLDGEQADWLQLLLQQCGEESVGSLIRELDSWRESRIDRNLLGAIGRFWDESPRGQDLIEHPSLTNIMNTIESMLKKDDPRSILLVGEPGVGKTAVAHALAEKLKQWNWSFFEAGHTDLLAGQIFIGQLEDRLRTLIQQLAGRRPIVWYIPDFHLLSWTGRHHSSPISVLDSLLPFIERREIKILGETTPVAYEQTIQSHPRCASAFDVMRMEPLDPESTLALAEKWAALRSPAGGPPLVSTKTLSEAWLLAQQYLGNKEAPGNLLEVLEITSQRLGHEAGKRSITLDDLILTLTRVTGLPSTLLDERKELSTEDLRKLFERRVLGQPEAVDCLTERVALIKAGVNDPTRPLGVFLFAGPTGSGKTEIAKTLTEFLFGSASRMIRLDMSEFQTAESLSRIVGDPNAAGGGALVDQIRKQPFSVVLLDEFEKAHPQVWDLFLQVFDDGRLTDRRGNTADCRHAIFTMTSNVGSSTSTGLRVGFTKESIVFNPEEVSLAIHRTFNKEFLNRIDRVVIFRPLSRENMRKILQKELDEVFQRRGLRRRTWAVVWDDDALEFLLEQGFTSDLGARPLKRAVERYLLTPLAMTIVHHRFPEGDQFLFVKHRGEALEVEFVDPDATEEAAEPAPIEEAPSQESPEAPSLASILMDPRGKVSELRCLGQHYDRIGELVQADRWKQTKQAALELIAQSDFWSSPDRFSILGEVEYLDRIEAGFETAGSLLNKLRQSASSERKTIPRHLTERLAHQLYLLNAACESVDKDGPRDAFIFIEAARETGSPLSLNNDFAKRLDHMYRAWAKKRRMKFEVLSESKNRDLQYQPYQLLAAVSGYAAYHLLSLENGLHLFEVPKAERTFHHSKAQVLIVPQPEKPAGSDPKEWRAQAGSLLAAAKKESPVIVRRYREEPSPLVRDSVRHWRTGRIDRVFGGDFDLFE